MKKESKFFAGSSGEPFARKMCDYLKKSLGPSEVIIFTEGNIFVKVGENVRGQDVVIVQSIGLDPNNQFVELLFWADAFKRTGANSVTIVMPYFSYAKADKKDEPRVSIRARVCAESLELAGADRIITMDLHSPQVQGFFKKPVDNLSAMPILCEYIKSLEIDNLVVASPDEGFTKDARNFANYLDCSLVIGHKIRARHDENAEIQEVIGDVKGKNVFIVDDFTITGNTAVKFAGELKRRGAKRIFLGLSHILLNEEGLKRVEESDIELVISTDSLNNRIVAGSDRIKIVSVAPLFAEVVRRMIKRRSISELFKACPKKVLKASF